MEKALKNKGRKLKLTTLGFTLIELLAVIIILAVIALIATPIVLNLVDEAKKQANLQTVNGIIDTARLYYTESMLDDDKKMDVDNINDIYPKISVQGHKPEVGKLYVNDKGLIAVSLILDEKCYIKNFTTNVEIKNKDNCDLGFVGKDEIKPTVEFNYSGTIGNNSWYTSDSFIKVTVKDNESGPRKFIWCSTESETCEPDNEVEKIEESIAITTNTVGKKICVKGIDNLNNSSEIICSSNVKVDKMAPTLIAKSDNITIIQGNSVETSTYFNAPTYSISGGSMSCNPTNTSSLAVGTQTVTCTATGNNGLIIVNSITITVKLLYSDGSGANVPELATNMIPVKWNGSSWVYADISTQWYNYNNKEWANSIILSDGISKTVGQTIAENEIAQMYVWIPRYKYKLFNANNSYVLPQQIDISFESNVNSTGTVICNDAINQVNTSGKPITQKCSGTSGTYTHPGFNFGGKQVKGFWFSKFEVSGTNEKLTIKPNTDSLRNVSLSNFFDSALKTKDIYNISVEDSHMMKNMEWGAVAYLTQSKYGLGSTEPARNTGSFLSGNGNYIKNTNLSSTLNIYGVYDLGGASEEYAMGVMTNVDGKINLQSTGFTVLPDSKYYDVYSYTTTMFDMIYVGRLGDATRETQEKYASNGISSWFFDYAYFPPWGGNWIVRSGNYSPSSYKGLYYIKSSLGSKNTDTSTRIVLINK